MTNIGYLTHTTVCVKSKEYLECETNIPIDHHSETILRTYKAQANNHLPHWTLKKDIQVKDRLTGIAFLVLAFFNPLAAADLLQRLHYKTAFFYTAGKRGSDG